MIFAQSSVFGYAIHPFSAIFVLICRNFQLFNKRILHRKISVILFLIRRTNIGKVINVAFEVPPTFFLQWKLNSQPRN